MARFWASWWQPLDGKDLEDIPTINEWQSGMRYPDKPDLPACPTCGHVAEYSETSIVALIDMEDEDTVRRFIEAHRPVTEWRFINQVADDWIPNDRFPMPADA